MQAEFIWIENLLTQVPISFAPPPSASFTLSYRPKDVMTKSDQLNLALSYKVYAEQNRVDQNEKETPGYEMVDLIFGYSVRKKNTLTVNFSVQNVFNKWYLNHLSRYRPLNIPEPGRNFIFFTVL